MPNMRKSVEISSLDSRFSLLDDASALKPVTGSTTLGRAIGSRGTGVKESVATVVSAARNTASGRFVSISVASSAKTATVVYKPTQLAQEERQERMNKIIRQGFVAGVRTTTK
jgi:hypothetical protein